MSYQAMWFRKAASQLRLLDWGENFENVRAMIDERFPLAVKKMKSKGLDLEDPNHWWELLFIDGLIKIENSQGEIFRVGIYLVKDWRAAEKTLEIIESRKFQTVRSELGIDQHWLILTDAKKPHSNDDWIDALYGQIDQEPRESGCALIEM